jgi:hypothetical protein
MSTGTIFGIVVIVVSVGAALVAILAYLGAGEFYRRIEAEAGVDDETREVIREEVRHALGEPTARRSRAP